MKNKKLLAVFLTGTMAAGILAGCGSSSDSGNSASQAATEAATEAAAEAATSAAAETSTEAATEAASSSSESTSGGMADWQPFAENVELKVPVYDRGVEGVPDVTDNYWTQWVQTNFGDKYNITVTYVPITRSDVMSDYAMLAASDSLPTILSEFDYPKLAQWATDGYLTTFDMDEFKQVAPTFYQAMEDNGLLEYSELDGETYFCLAQNPYYETNYNWEVFYRKDWLEQIGYDEYPTKWEERKEMYQKLIDAGICEYPLGGQMSNGLGADQNYAFRDYPQDEETWAVYGNYTIPALGQEWNRRYLERENEKYNLGFTDPEYYTIDSETAKSNFVSGKTLEFGGYISANMDFISAFYENNPDGELAVLVSNDTVDDDGSVPFAFRSNNPFGVMSGFSSQATEDEIKAAWMYMEWLLQDDNLFTMQWGIEGENFNYDENGVPVSVGDYDGDMKQGYSNNKDYWNLVMNVRTAGTIEDTIRQNTPTDVPNAEELTQGVIDNFYAQEKLAEEGYSVKDCLYATAIESESEYQETLINDYKEFRDKIIMADPDDFDATYDELAQDFADDGWQEIVDERTEAYENGLTTKLD